MCVSLLFILILLLILIIRNKIIEKFNNNKTYYLIANNPKILPKSKNTFENSKILILMITLLNIHSLRD